MDIRRISKPIVAAVLTAAAVAAIALLSRTPPEPGSPNGEPTPEPEALAADERPPQLGEERPDRPLDPDRLGTGEDSVIQRADPETGRLVQEFSADRLTPQAEGVFDLVGPWARLYLAPWRVIHMRSDEGRFVAPGRHLQSGEFHEDVVVTLFQAEEGDEVDLSADSADRLLRMEMDHARFDTTLGEIRSDSDVELTSPGTGQVRFRGKGLTLIYNQPEKRIDYLKIDEGRSLRYDPDAAADRTGEPSDAESGEARSGNDGSRDSDSDGPPPFYRVTFERNIHVRRAERAIEAERMVVYFPMDRDAAADPAPDGEGGEQEAERSAALHQHQARRMLPVVLGRVASVMPLMLAQSGEEPEPSTRTVSGVANTGEGPVRMTWSGSMVMEPAEIDELPEAMAGAANEKAMHVRFEGSPVTVTLGETERLVCRDLEYTEPTQLVTATGSAAYPLRIESPDLGRLSAERLVMRPAENTGELIGAGSIRNPDTGNNADGEGEEGQRQSADGLPPGFRIAWQDRVALEFGDLSDSDARIRSATFHGGVSTESPSFELNSDQLAVRFEDAPGPSTGTASAEGERAPDSAGRRLRAIEAIGSVEANMDQQRMRAERLRIRTEPDADGNPWPTEALAEGSVTIEQPDQRLAAGRVLVALGPPDPEQGGALIQSGQLPATADAPEPGRSKSAAAKADADDDNPLGGEVTVKRLDASEDVHLTLANGTEVFGDKLEADAAANTAKLIGSPARITRAQEPGKDGPPRTELRVLELDIEEGGRIARSDGAGTFIYTEPPAPESEEPGRRVKVTWVDRMRFDDEANVIRVFGDVKAEAENAPSRLDRLTAGQLELQLVDPQVIAQIEGEGDGEAEASEDPQADEGPVEVEMSRRRLRRLVARDDVVLLSTEWQSPNRQQVVRRFRLNGPVLSFRQAERVARIIGAGSMLVEDYRSGAAQSPAPQGGDEDEAAGQSLDRAVALSGRGATLFTWSDRLELDEINKDMTIRGDVRMSHEAAEAERFVELQTDHLTADMASVGELRPLSGPQDGSLSINGFRADGAVQLRDGQRVVSADELRYEGADRQIMLFAEGDNRVEIADLDEPRPLRAGAVRWDLDNDTIEAIEVSR